MLKMPKAILFDLDGTLANTAPDLVGATNKVCTQEGQPQVPYEVLAPHASAGTAALLYAALGLKQDDADFSRLKTDFLAHYERGIADKTHLYPGVAALLSYLESVDVAWGIVTNKPSKYTNLLVPLVKLGSAGCVISGDTTAYSKPHPEPLFEAARRLDISAKDCWYIGDDLRDMQAAKAAGMFAIAAAWGYGEGIASWPADLIVNDAEELSLLLSRASTVQVLEADTEGPCFS